MNKLERIKARYAEFKRINYRSVGGGYTRELASAERDTAKASADDIPLLLAVAEAAINRDVAVGAETKFRLSAWYAGTVEGDSEKAFRAYMDASERTRAARGAYEAAIAPLLEEEE